MSKISLLKIFGGFFTKVQDSSQIKMPLLIQESFTDLKVTDRSATEEV